jgi:hypothetical protein
VLEKDKDAAAELLRGCQADLRKAQRQRQEAQVCTELYYSSLLALLVQKNKTARTNTAKQTSGKRRRHSVCLFYWYKSANTDAARGGAGHGETAARGHRVRRQFTCFTGTKERILTQQEGRRTRRNSCERPQSPTPVYLLYWYKRKNTDAARGAQDTAKQLREATESDAKRIGELVA